MSQLTKKMPELVKLTDMHKYYKGGMAANPPALEDLVRFFSEDEGIEGIIVEEGPEMVISLHEFEKHILAKFGRLLFFKRRKRYQ